MEQAELIYAANSRFDSICGQAWTDYIRWSGLSHLKEVVSLDIILCAPAIAELMPEDWNHNVQTGFRPFYFRDLPYLLGRVGKRDRLNVLAIVAEPSQADLGWQQPLFRFEGFDLIEEAKGISALTNCGGFDAAFLPDDLRSNGLVGDLARARQIQQKLIHEYPNEPHADCILWAIWRHE